jgi:hypothetical protein
MSDFAGSLTVVAAFRSSVMHHAHAKVYDESDYSKTPDPVDVCMNHLHYGVVRSFLERSCQIGVITIKATRSCDRKVGCL